MSEERPPNRVYPWYELRTIESGGGDIEFTCKRCRYVVTVTPRHGEEPPSICPQCNFDGS
jgi:hypothetical protein